jgi:hypothetical protein
MLSRKRYGNIGIPSFVALETTSPHPTSSFVAPIHTDTVDAVVNAGVVETRMEAVELARTLARELSLLRHVCGDHAFCDDHLFFRLEDKEIRDAKLREYLGPAEKRRDFETEPISEFQAETTTRKDGKIAAD